jgi:hypothetical protein
MYPVIIITLLCAGFCICPIINQAQTFAEWWQQKKTRIQYLQQQAAALSALKKTAEKGYQIAEEGIQNIRELKDDEFGLHSSYFHSLEVASSAATNSPELSACLSRLRSLLNLISDKLHAYSADPISMPDDLIFIKRVFNYAMAQLQENVQHLLIQVTDYQLKMTEGERLLAIQSIEEEIQKQYEFITFFLAMRNELILYRIIESDDILKTLHLYQ